MTDGQNGFAWYQLVTSDPDSAAAFYASVAGWSVTERSEQGNLLAAIGQSRVAGITLLAAEGPITQPAWVGQISVANIDDTISRIAEAKGSVLRPPFDIPNVGRLSVVTDPQGAPFTLCQRNEPVSKPAADTLGAIGWHELHTTNWSDAFAFYQSVFGWEKREANNMGPAGMYQTFAINGVWSGGIMNGGGSPTPHWLFYINVDDIEDAAHRVTKAGGKVSHGPQEVPSGNWVVMGLDAQGAEFALSGPRQS